MLPHCRRNMPSAHGGSSSLTRSRIPIRSRPTLSGRHQYLGSSALRPSSSAGEPARMSSAQIRKFLEDIDSERLTEDNVLKDFLRLADIDEEDGEEVSIVDLGCGNGRVSFLLHDLLPESQIRGLDHRLDLLEAARAKRTEILKTEDQWEDLDGKLQAPRMQASTAGMISIDRLQIESKDIEVAESRQEILGFLRFDIHHESPFTQRYGNIGPTELGELSNASTSQSLLLPELSGGAHAVVCSLFLNTDVSLPRFFAAVEEMLGRGGFLLVTDIHPNARKIPGLYDSLAGDGEASPHQVFPHTEASMVEEARRRGFSVRSKSYRYITYEDVKDLSDDCLGWIGVMCWFSISFELKIRK